MKKKKTTKQNKKQKRSEVRSRNRRPSSAFVCSRLRDSRVRWIEKVRTWKKQKTKNKKSGGNQVEEGPFLFPFSCACPANFLRAFHFSVFHTPSCLPHYLYYLRAWNRLEWYRSASDASCMHASCIPCMPASCIGTVRIRRYESLILPGVVS